MITYDIQNNEIELVLSEDVVVSGFKWAIISKIRVKIN